MSKKILIFGQNGQVASNLIALLNKESKFNYSSYSSKEIDFSNLENLQNKLNSLKEIPDFIINAAAYTKVDKAEEEQKLASKINHKAVEIIANYCAKNNVKLIHYSTDYVFDGSGNQPFSEENIKDLKPLNHYGQSKLNGEKAILDSGCKYIILRTSWVYDKKGHNFVNTVIRLAKEREILGMINDQIGSPTYAYDIALHTIEIIKKLVNMDNSFPNGIYHLTNNGYNSWYDFTMQIIEILKEKKTDLKIKEINKIKTSDYKTPAIRPLNSRLSHQKIEKTFNIKIRNWQEALKDCLS